MKKPWPTKAAMAQIYEKGLWGDDGSDFYSGEGSHLPRLVDPYVKVVGSFLSSFDTPPVVCDLGCGDFYVGKELVKYAERYVAVDIVDELISRNKDKFQHEDLEFQCLDISKDQLPSGDCALLRQVLQHLSNSEVSGIVSRLKDFKYVILTEHVPDGDFIPNKDIISGQGIRIKKDSGIDLLESPFNLKVKDHKMLLTLPAVDGKGLIRTQLFEMF